MDKKPNINPSIFIEACNEYKVLLEISNEKHYKKGWAFYRLRDKYGETIANMAIQKHNNPSLQLEQAYKIVEQKNVEKWEVTKKIIDLFIQEERSKRSYVKKHINTNLKEQYNADRFKNDPRDYLKGIGKCPHGVPFYQTCAICNPDKFRIDNGSD